MEKILLEEAEHYRNLWEPVAELMNLPIKEIAHLELFQPGEQLIRYENGTDFLFVLLAGQAKIYKIHEDGKQSIIQFVHQGELIGELSLLGVEERTKDVVAQNTCLCLAIPLSLNREKMLTNPAFLRQLSVYLGQKLLSRTDWFSEGLNYPLINRLAAFILQTETDGLYREKHTEVAEYLSISYRHLLYTFKQLREAGLLVKEQGGYRLINPSALKKLAKDIHA